VDGVVWQVYRIFSDGIVYYYLSDAKLSGFAGKKPSSFVPQQKKLISAT